MEYASDNRKTDSSRTADRVLRLLTYLAGHGGPVGVTHAARYLGVSTAATHRLLQSLVASGYAVRGENRTYELGPGALRLAQHYLAGDVRERYRPLLHRVTDITEETACLIVSAGLQRVCIDYVLSNQPIAYIPTVGQTVPLAMGAVGRAFLSEMTPAETERFESQLPATGPGRQRWDAQVADGRGRGYFVALSELIPDMNGLAFALPDSRRRGVSVLSITGPAYRLPVKRINQLAAEVRMAISDYVTV